MKKGVELALNTIIFAALAVIVLIVLALIFSGRLSIFSRGTDDCYTAGGQCVDVRECSVLNRAEFGCGDDALVCCINPCVSEGGLCVPVCDGPECNGKCPSETKRLYLTGCGEGRVCCKAGE